ncbi:single-stranded DNA-binding protein [Lysinibacillus sp. NPDC093712]|uniref:single-stranded DNA-binding protein n=1 Tax=Lysinibacillus sp. NPDC093712 TaxID=3390579 RepID=UPI003D01CDA3
MKNICSFTGNTTKDIDFKYTDDGKGRAVFSIGVNNGKEDADFIQIKAFGDLAVRIADHVGKGSLITVDTRYKPGKYQKEGKTIYTHDFIAFNVDFLALKPINGAQGNNNNGQPNYGHEQPNVNNGHFGGQPNGGQPNYGQGQSNGSQPNYANGQPNYPNQPPANYPNPY